MINPSDNIFRVHTPFGVLNTDLSNADDLYDEIVKYVYELRAEGIDEFDEVDIGVCCISTSKKLENGSRYNARVKTSHPIFLGYTRENMSKTQFAKIMQAMQAYADVMNTV